MKAGSVLVTGGAGFIGSHVAEALLREGREVTILDDLSSGKEENLPDAARFIRGSILEEKALEEAMKGVEAVVHLAARVAIRDSFRHFLDDARANVMGTLNVLRLAGERGIRRLLFASSMAVYADRNEPVPIPETFPREPISPYGVSKLASEQYLLLLAGRQGISPVILRYFNVYGPRQAFTPYVGVVTIFAKRLVEGLPPLVFGDGEQQRDFVHVEDVARATLLALDSGLGGEVFNVGTGKGTSVNEVARILIDRLSPGLHPHHLDAQPGEIRHAIADISKIGRLLGFRPARRFPEGLDEILPPPPPHEKKGDQDFRLSEKRDRG